MSKQALTSKTSRKKNKPAPPSAASHSTNVRGLVTSSAPVRTGASTKFEVSYTPKGADYNFVAIRGMIAGFVKETAVTGGVWQHVTNYSQTSTFYAMPIIPTWQQLFPTTLVNVACAYGAYRIERARLRLVPVQGTSELQLGDGLTKTGIYSSVTAAIVNVQDLPKPSDGGETTIVSFGTPNMEAYPNAITTDPSVPAVGEWWQRRPEDMRIFNTSGYDDYSNGWLITPLAIAAYWPSPQSSAYNGTLLMQIQMDIDITFLYRRGFDWSLNTTSPFRCLVCKDKTRVCGLCGGTSKRAYASDADIKLLQKSMEELKLQTMRRLDLRADYPSVQDRPSASSGVPTSQQSVQVVADSKSTAPPPLPERPISVPGATAVGTQQRSAAAPPPGFNSRRESTEYTMVYRDSSGREIG